MRRNTLPCYLALLGLLVLLSGCEVAQNRVYILLLPGSASAANSALPNQGELTEALQEFIQRHGGRCRQHVKRWDEWACNGPIDIRVTFEPDRGKDRCIADFSLVARTAQEQEKFDAFVDEFANAMEAKFPGAILYAPRLDADR